MAVVVGHQEGQEVTKTTAPYGKGTVKTRRGTGARRARMWAAHLDGGLGLFGEHVKLRCDGEGLEVHAEGPAHVREEVLVQVWVQDAGKGEARRDRVDNA